MKPATRLLTLAQPSEATAKVAAAVSGDWAAAVHSASASAIHAIVGRSEADSTPFTAEVFEATGTVVVNVGASRRGFTTSATAHRTNSAIRPTLRNRDAREGGREGQST